MANQGRPGARLALDAARIAAVAFTYFVAAKLGLRLATVGVTVTLVWPASGVAVAALLVLGWRTVVGGALGASLTPLPPSAALGVPCPPTVGKAPKPPGATVLPRRAEFNPRIQRVRDVFSL